jgi:hypothetical protein
MAAGWEGESEENGGWRRVEEFRIQYPEARRKVVAAVGSLSIQAYLNHRGTETQSEGR